MRVSAWQHVDELEIWESQASRGCARQSASYDLRYCAGSLGGAPRAVDLPAGPACCASGCT